MKQRPTTGQWTDSILAFIGEQRDNHLSALTVESYCRRIRLFATEHPAGPWNVTRSSIDRWIDAKAAEGWTEATAKAHRSALRLFYRWAVSTGRSERDPASAPRRSWKPNPDPMLEAYRVSLLAGGRAHSTVNLRIGHLRTLLKTHPDLLAVTRRDLLAYFADRRDTHKAETRKSMRSSFRSFYAWAVDEGLLEEDPASRLERVRGVHRGIGRIALDDDIRAGLKEANADERAMLLLGRLGCLRRTEIATLRISDRQGSQLLVLGKGGKRRRVDIGSTLLEALEQLERTGRRGYYFPGRCDGHVHVDTVHSVVQRLTGWNTHSLRHAGATAAYRGTLDIMAVQELLGHASVATTQMYVHVEDAARRAAAEAAAVGF